ncbi:MAG: thiamine-phosphate kinase [Gammaproteobacteria bacterium]|jgi:thiamine-monophosphate kinase|nr:thiamine-phosphate kinase [Gammaproteobacteria bacterium]
MREFDLIDRYFSGLTPTEASVKCGIGDDAAVIDISPQQELLVSVDTLVEGVHFFPSAAAFDIAYKSLAVNISDIAAMGGEPRWATLALTLPNIDPDWLQSFADGFVEVANKYGVCLIGGDTCQGPLSVTVQIMGTAEKGHSIKRSGALAGDLIYVSGNLGMAGLAYKSLMENTDGHSVSSECFERLHRPAPRVELGKQLSGLASSAIDISDGLGSDLNHVLLSSGVAAEIELDKLPVCKDVAQLEDKELLWQLTLATGDDYELCFTLPIDKQIELEKRAKNISYPITCIGKIVSGEGIRWMQEDGSDANLDLKGYQHFSKV